MTDSSRSSSQSEGMVQLAHAAYFGAIQRRVQAEHDELEAKRQYEAERQRHWMAFGEEE